MDGEGGEVRPPAMYWPTGSNLEGKRAEHGANLMTQPLVIYRPDDTHIHTWTEMLTM